jgi:acyl carrier protein
MFKGTPGDEASNLLAMIGKVVPAGPDPLQIREETSFEDLGIDSMGMVSLGMLLSETYLIPIDQLAARIEDFTTVGRFVEIVLSILDAEQNDEVPENA